MKAATTDGAPSTLESITGQLFERVVVGVDSSPASSEAARQAAVLTAARGTLSVIAAWTLPPPPIGVVSPTRGHELDDQTYREAAARALGLATSSLAAASQRRKVVNGFAWDELIKEANATDATLIVVGSHGQGRMRGILMGSTATQVVHQAPCPVLIARPAGPRFPQRIVVGVDGSRESETAYHVASTIARRFGSELWPLVAHGGKGVDVVAVSEIAPYRREDSPDGPVEALVAASADADLVVVGSRALHGLQALGSVSERVAHRSRSSTLIVRPQAVES